jgi:hypothetical protein
LQANFQIRPVFAQEFLGLLQGFILGQMWCSLGLTTNGPDYNKLLSHLCFPELMKNDHWMEQLHSLTEIFGLR